MVNSEGFLKTCTDQVFYQFGYRIYEEEKFNYPPVDSTLTIKSRGVASGTIQRSPVSSSLPIFWSEAVRPKPDHRDPLNLVCGVIQRFGNETPPITKSIQADLKRFVDLWLRRHLKPIEPDELMTFEQWIEQSPYSSNRRAQLIACNNQIKNACRRRGRNKKFKRVKSFVKDEGYDAFKKPRLINSRCDAAKCFSGPVFQQISDRLFALPPFIKKIPFSDRPMVIRDALEKAGSVYCCDDYTTFEAHFTDVIMECLEFRLYKYMVSKLSFKKEFMKFCTDIIAGENEISFDLLKVRLKAKRMSGEMNTSLGNGFSNLMVHLYSYYIKSGRDKKAVDEMLHSIFVEGDDSIARYTNQQHAPTAADLLALGWTVKHEVFDELGMASFCGCVFDPDDMVIISNPIRMLASFGWGQRRYISAGKQVKIELLVAKALSYLHQYTHCPIIDVFCRRVLLIYGHVKIRESVIRSFEPHKQSLIREAISKGIPAYKPIPLKTRTLMERKFGIPVGTQLLAEIHIGLIQDGGPFRLDILKDFVPPSWARTANDYVTCYYDMQFRVGVPLDSASGMLDKLVAHTGAHPQILQEFSIHRNMCCLDGQRKITSAKRLAADDLDCG